MEATKKIHQKNERGILILRVRVCFFFFVGVGVGSNRITEEGNFLV